MYTELKENQTFSQEIVSFKGLNSGRYTWNINDNDVIHKILNASNKQKFESKPFTLAKLQWMLELYPNGDDIDAKGSVVVFFGINANRIG